MDIFGLAAIRIKPSFMLNQRGVRVSSSAPLLDCEVYASSLQAYFDYSSSESINDFLHGLENVKDVMRDMT